MSERFKDFMVFVGSGSLLMIVAFIFAALWMAMSSSNLPFCERWAPAVSLPPALEMPHKKRPAEIPVFFCGRYVSTNQCRTA